MKISILICIYVIYLVNISICKKIKPQQVDWTPVNKILEAAVINGTFPGCVALIANENGIVYEVAVGNYTYGVPPPFNDGKNPAVNIDTLFDLASCSKVTGATTAVAQFYQRGELDLNTRVEDILGKDYGVNGKEGITVLNCLLHNAGYPPDPNPNYNDPEFGCPETDFYYPQLNFSCQDRIYKSLLDQTLANPVGSTYVYSDLSFITLMYVVGTLARDLNYVTEKDLIQDCIVNPNSNAITQCYFEAYIRIYVFQEFQMTNSGFLPNMSLWPDCMPCENDTSYTHKVIQGQVSDGNAYAMGGIAGHAGIFSNVHDLHILMHKILFAEEDDPIINKTTADFFIKEYNHSQSSRALGWNTNDPTVYDYGWDLLCGDMSATTFMHVGYTGTQMCGDPERNLITILLTNRVYPTDLNLQIEDLRRRFNSEVVKIYDNNFMK